MFVLLSINCRFILGQHDWLPAKFVAASRDYFLLANGMHISFRESNYPLSTNIQY